MVWLGRNWPKKPCQKNYLHVQFKLQQGIHIKIRVLIPGGDRQTNDIFILEIPFLPSFVQYFIKRKLTRQNKSKKVVLFFFSYLKFFFDKSNQILPSFFISLLSVCVVYQRNTFENHIKPDNRHQFIIRHFVVEFPILWFSYLIYIHTHRTKKLRSRFYRGQKERSFPTFV